MSTTNLPTLKNFYTNGDREYVFAVKSRPFACLVSPHLSTPTSSLIDYDLVRSLGLKMSDFKCQKFFFGGFKMRILGKVSLTVQTIQDGLPCGTFHIKANVVTDISKNFDTDCVAGSKTRSQLETRPVSSAPAPTSTGRPSPTSSTGRPSPTSSTGRPSPPPQGRPSPPPSTRLSPSSNLASTRSQQYNVVSDMTLQYDMVPTRTQQYDVVPNRSQKYDVVPSRPTPSAMSPRRLSSPPGFPQTPKYVTGSVPAASACGGSRDVPDDDDDDALDDLQLDHGCETPRPVPAKEIADQANFTASQANSYTMKMAFGDADLAKTEDEARKILFDHCPCGTEEEMKPKFTFSHYDGYLFQFGHGRNKCSRRKCLTQADATRLPSNCVFHHQWCWPTNFLHCSLQCKGAFCPCLDNYPSQGGDYF